MWLYDYNDVSLPDAVSDGFKGFVTRAKIFDFLKKRLRNIEPSFI